MGPSLTHKREIIERLFLKGQPVERVCRETYHSPAAVQRYIAAFKQVLLCRQKGLSHQEIAFAIKMSERLVREYQNLTMILYNNMQDWRSECNRWRRA